MSRVCGNFSSAWPFAVEEKLLAAVSLEIELRRYVPVSRKMKLLNFTRFTELGVSNVKIQFEHLLDCL